MNGAGDVARVALGLVLLGCGANAALWSLAAARGQVSRRVAALAAGFGALQAVALGYGGGVSRLRSPLHALSATVLLGVLYLLSRPAPARVPRDRRNVDRALLAVSAGLVGVIAASPTRPEALARMAALSWLNFGCDVLVLGAAMLAMTTHSRSERVDLAGLPALTLAAAVFALRNLVTLVPSAPLHLVPGTAATRVAAVGELALLVFGASALLRRRPSRLAFGGLGVLAGTAPGFAGVIMVEAYSIAGLQVPTAMTVTAMGIGALLFLRLGTALQDNQALEQTLESQVEARTLELVTRERWFRSLVQNSSDALTVVDPRGTVLYQSPAFERLFGHDASGMVGMSLTPLLQPEQAEQLAHTVAAVASAAAPTSVLELDLWHRDGRWSHTETVVSCLQDDPAIRGAVLNIRDISDRRQLQQRLAHEASHDTLTGLANRALLQARLAEATLAGDANHVAVLFCDLDGFKAVNDSRGHETGDVLLQAVAGRLAGCVREDDVVARFGGDEFAILVRDPDVITVAQDVAERVVAALAQPFRVGDSELRIGVSVGISVGGVGARTAEELLRNADLAMYRSKTSRNESVTLFKPAMHDALLAQLEVEDDLREALGRGQLVLHYQTLVELATRRPVGVEALMRWYHPERGIVTPEKFIAVAEEKGYIEAMGQWALHEAARAGARWQELAPPDEHIEVAVNISPWQVVPALVGLVAGALEASGLPPAALVLEVTESVLLDRTAESAEVLASLKALGVRIAVDDFGTGYSSLSYLSRFPVDILKVDRQFVEALTRSADAVALTRTILNLGQALGLTTIAEGVENWQQVHILTDLGCQRVQGYLFCRPLPATGITQVFALEQPAAERRLPAGVVPLRRREAAGA